MEKQVPLDLERTMTTCVLCGLGCEIDVLTLDGSYMRTVPADGKSVLCARGRYGWHTVGSDKRITTPMIRSGSALREASWSEALREAGQRLTAAKGRVAAFGSGLLTCEEGWLVARIAEGLGAGAPVFDINVWRPQIEISEDRVVSLSGLSQADLIVVVGGRGTYEKVTLDVVLREEISRGAHVVSYGADVPGALKEFSLTELDGLLTELDRGGDLFGGEATAAENPVFLFEESRVTRHALEGIATFLQKHPSWRLAIVPATANAIGLRHLGFSEQLRTDAKAWLTIASDPVAMVGGRQHLLAVDTLVAVSPVQTQTTARADVVFPMRLPYEARGQVIGARGPRTLVSAVDGPLAMETWEVLLRIAGSLGLGPLPWHFEALTAAARCGDIPGQGGLTAAGATPASIAALVDRNLEAVGV